MISANIKTSTRKAVYRRDGYSCALCDSTQYLQVHHYIERGAGGYDIPQNLITLCSRCHGQAHGIDLYDSIITQDDIEQAIVEYLADYYTSDTTVWNPWGDKLPYEPWNCKTTEPTRRE